MWNLAEINSTQKRAKVETRGMVPTHHPLFNANSNKACVPPFSAVRMIDRILQTAQGKDEEE